MEGIYRNLWVMLSHSERNFGGKLCVGVGATGKMNENSTKTASNKLKSSMNRRIISVSDVVQRVFCVLMKRDRLSLFAQYELGGQRRVLILVKS